MAATAHSDPYGIFLRKIGYSVGLEHTLDRIRDLQELYVSKGDLTLSSWKELVESENGWKRKTHDIADFFFALRLIHRSSGDLLILENLDAMAIATTLLNSDDEKEIARLTVFLWAVIVSDGEIFMNLLLSGFEEEIVKEKLSAMIAVKRKKLAKVILGKDAIKRIARIVAIERQESNKGSAGVGHSIESMRRTDPLHSVESMKRTGPLNMDSLSSVSFIEQPVTFSDDYFRKVPPRRKDWARTLGLWSDDTGLTSLGFNFINTLKSYGYVSDDEVFVFWPMDYELVRSGLKPNLFKETKTLWETLIDFATAHSGLCVKPFENSDTDTLVNMIDSMMKVYRSLHKRKLILRRELAFTVAYPAIVAIASARNEPVIDFPKALNAEQNGEHRRITSRRSRNTGGALRMKH